jgi:hypothetical protein
MIIGSDGARDREKQAGSHLLDWVGHELVEWFEVSLSHKRQNTVTRLMRLGTKNRCAGEGQQQFNSQVKS